MSATEERDEATGLAPTNTTKALALARQICDPWFRCQALADVARYASTELVSPIAHEAINTALQQEDAYKAVAASAWPVRAVIERNQTELLPLLLNDLVKRARSIDHPISRLEALFLMWQASFPFVHSETDEILEEFIRACKSANSWKAGARFEEAILIWPHAIRDAQPNLRKECETASTKRRTLKRLSESDHQQPRPFFWGDA